MKKEAKILLEKSKESLILSVEHFNRPSDCGRVQAILILLDHSFEMLLKAAILHRGGKIRKPRERQTIGFDECVRKALSDGRIKFISREQALLLQTINSLRDAAYHHLLEISEKILYVQAQAGLSLYSQILYEVFGEELYNQLPERVLPLSTTPLTDIDVLFQNEIKEIKKLLQPGIRRKIEVSARLRTLSIIDGSVKGQKVQPGQNELRKLGSQILKGIQWTRIFPGLASIQLTTKGYGPSLDLRIAKKEGTPVFLVPEGTPGAAVVAVKRVNELSFYSLNRTAISKKIGLTTSKTSALIWFLDLQRDPECFKEIIIGKSKYKQYSQKAIEKIKIALPKIDMEDIWQRYYKSIKPQKRD